MGLDRNLERSIDSVKSDLDYVIDVLIELVTEKEDEIEQLQTKVDNLNDEIENLNKQLNN